MRTIIDRIDFVEIDERSTHSTIVVCGIGGHAD